MSHHIPHAPKLSALFFALALAGTAACDGGSNHGALSDAAVDGLDHGDAGSEDQGDGDGDGVGDEGDASRDAGHEGEPSNDAGDDGARCGIRGSITCDKDEFCDYAVGSQCGALDQGGTCKPKRNACPAIYAPVCGCDDKTYDSTCNANAAGVSVKSQGECKGTGSMGKTCGGFIGQPCDGGQFCNYDEVLGGQGCGIADGAGVCTDKPSGCTKEYQPVCGCNGATYDNACSAHMAGVSVAKQGPCPK